jgi:DNA-binding transcriptional LysR family regulator
MSSMCAVHLRNIDLNLLLPLQALLEERSVTRAGKRVHLSQPAMSRALERLREVLADDLLIRSHKEYQLTARGAELLNELDLLLPRLEQLWSGKEFSPQVTTGRVRLAMTDFASALILPRLMHELGQMAPGLQVEIVPWHDRSFDDVIAGKIDLLFSPLAAPPPLNVELLFDERFVCLMALAHPFKGKALSLKQYLQCSHIAIEIQISQQTLVDRPLGELGYRRQVALRVPFFISGIMALENTELVLTSPLRLAREMSSRYRVRMVKAPAEIPGFQYSMVWHPRLHSEALHSWFRSVVQQACASLLEKQGQST